MNIEYFIYDHKKHSQHIESILDGASRAHGNIKKTADWFHWKFLENPFGNSLLACGLVDDKIVGCVSYGIQPFIYNNIEFIGALAFENFVHPDFQRNGIFGNLISLCEDEAIKREIDFLLVFPNSNSLRGYLKRNWKSLENLEYWIRLRLRLNNLLNIKEIKSEFRFEASNLDEIKSFIASLPSIVPKDYKDFSSKITSDYLHWRFFTFEVSKYRIINNADFFAIYREGKRGTFKELQLLYLCVKDESIKLSSVYSDSKRNLNFDIMSCSISKKNTIRKNLMRNLFIKVPNKANFCYKILNCNRINDEIMNEISLSAINYHTY